MTTESQVVTAEVATQEVPKDTIEVETNIEPTPENGVPDKASKAPADVAQAETQEQVQKRSRSEKRKAEKDRILQENATLRERNRVYEEQIKGKQPEKADGEPNIADYDDVMLYYRDLNKYDAQQLLKSDREKQAEFAKQQEVTQAQEAKTRAYVEKLQPILQEDPALLDRLESLETKGLISKNLQNAVEDSSSSDKITKYLSQLPDHIIGQLSALSEKEVYKAIGILEAQLEAPKENLKETPRASKATPPINPPRNIAKTDRSINSYTQEEIENMPLSEYKKITFN